MEKGTKSEPTFNGAYYSAGGPPPPSPRRRHGGCCGPCCLLKFLLKLAISVIVVVGIAALVIWLVLRPTKPKFYVDSAQFNNATNTSNSNIVLGMTVRNANRRIGIYYGIIRLSAYYGGQAIGLTSLPEFYQGHKNTTALNPIFNSESVNMLSTSEGQAEVEVKLRSRVRVKVGDLKTGRYTLKVKCNLSLPLNEASATTFSRKKCKVDFER